MTATAQQLDLANFLDPDTKLTDKMLEGIRAYQKDSEEQGGLVTQAQAAGVLDLSQPRMHELQKNGTLPIFEHFGKKLIGVETLIAYGKLQKLDGGTGAAIARAFKAEYATTKKKG